jgi:hypothetical protein
VAINNIGINTQSFGVQRQTGGAGNANQEVAQSFNDGFQPSGITANPEVNPAAGQPAEVTLTVTPSQLSSQAFQATLAQLSASGIPVQVVMVAEGALNTKPAATQASQTQTQAPAQQDYNFSQPAPAKPAPAPRHQTPRYGGD